MLPWLAIDSFSVFKTNSSNSDFIVNMVLSRVTALSLREFLNKMMFWISQEKNNNLISTRIIILSIICFTSKNSPPEWLTADSRNLQKCSSFEILFVSLKRKLCTISGSLFFYLSLVSFRIERFFSIFFFSAPSLACFCFSIISLLSSSATFLCFSYHKTSLRTNKTIKTHS